MVSKFQTSVLRMSADKLAAGILRFTWSGLYVYIVVSSLEVGYMLPLVTARWRVHLSWTSELVYNNITERL